MRFSYACIVFHVYRQSKIGAMDILSGLTFSAPQQISAALSDIIPIVSETMWDSKPEVCSHSLFSFFFTKELHNSKHAEAEKKAPRRQTQRIATQHNTTHNTTSGTRKNQKRAILDSTQNSTPHWTLDWARTGLEITHITEKEKNHNKNNSARD